MRSLLKLWAFAGLILLSGDVFSQSNDKDHFKDAEGNTWHQLFLDFQATEIKEMKYTDESSEIDGQLSPDGFSILFKNYPGNKTVKVSVTDLAGQTREVTKSKCFIDPVLLHL